MATITPQIVEIEEQEALAFRGEVMIPEMPDFFGKAFTAVWAAAGQAGVEIIGPPFAFYPAMPTDTVIIEAGAPVASAPEDIPGEVHRLVLPGGRAVVAIHIGPYETMEKTYAALQAWMAQNGVVPAAGMWEIYLTDPETEPDSSKWQTKIVWPIA